MASAHAETTSDRTLGVSADYPPQTIIEPLPIDESLLRVVDAGKPASVDDLRAVQQQVRRVVNTLQKSIVAIELNDSLGSGVIVSDDGLVMTAGHVTVEPNRPVWVRLTDGRRYRGRSLGVNHYDDSGLVKITAEAPDDAWPAAPLATEPAEVGDWVIAMGHPNGFVDGRLPPLRLGRVLMREEGALSTDATLVGGDSGGPLLNLRGEVVGIHSRIGERITSNFHVPIEDFEQRWERLAAGRMTGSPEGEDPTRARPHVGVAVAMKDGRCVVTQVFPRSPAAEAGIRVGDCIARIGESNIVSVTQLTRIMSRLEPYERIEFTLERDEAEDSAPVEKTIWLGRVDRGFPGLAMETPADAHAYDGAGP